MKRTFFFPAGLPDLTERVNRAIAATAPEDEIYLEFEAGTHYFHRTGTKKHRIFSSGAATTDNYVVFPFYGRRGITVEGNGADFVFCDRMQPFMFTDCENITLCNFTMDYAFLRYAYGTVREKDETGFTMMLDPSLAPYRTENGFLIFQCGEDALSSEYRRISVKRISSPPYHIYHANIGETQVPLSTCAPPLLADAQTVDGGVRFTYRPDTVVPQFDDGDTVCLAYDNNREAQAFYCDHCRNITVDNVAIYRNGGMGFVADMSENITLSRYRLALKEGRQEYYSSTADGVFLTNCSGTFTMRDSVIRNTYDDAMNVHGYYVLVDEILSPHRVSITHPHPAHWGLVPAMVGDRLHVHTANEFNEVAVLTVTDVSFDENRENIVYTFAEEFAFVPGMLIENPDRTPQVLLENNVVEHCPHIRLSARRMAVKHNVLSLNDADLLICDLIDYWGESGAVEALEVTGNTFGNTAPHNVEMGSCRPSTSNRLHQHLILRDNRFLLPREQALSISGTRQITEENNRFQAE